MARIRTDNLTDKRGELEEDYRSGLRLFSRMMDRKDTLTETEEKLYVSLGEWLIWYEKEVDPIPRPLHEISKEDRAIFEATRNGTHPDLVAA